MNLKAMVMSAGMGSRLEPLTLQVPKPLVTVANRAIMDILFENHLPVPNCWRSTKDVNSLDTSENFKFEENC